MVVSGEPLISHEALNSHLVVEDLRLSRLGLGDQGLVKDAEDISAHLLQLGLDLLTVLADLGNMLLVVLGLLLLLDAGDDAPRSTSCTDDVLVSNGQQVALVDGEFTTKLRKGSIRVQQSAQTHLRVRPTAFRGKSSRTFATSY
jgi:hypothetical protein